MSQTHAEPASGESAEDRTLGELVALVSRDVSHLVRSEIDLAKAEITADVKRGGVSGGLFAGAGFFGYVMLMFMSVAAALALGYVLPLAVGFAIIGGIYLVLMVVFGLVGAVNLRYLNKAKRTLRTAQGTLAIVKRQKSTEPQTQE